VSDPVEAYVDAGAEALGLVLSPESRAAVIANTRILRKLAATFEAEPLGPHDDPLPVFRP
jgi:hypothetical protein